MDYIIKNYNYNNIAKFVADVRDNKIKFPFKRHLIKPDTVLNMFSKLQKYNYKTRIELSIYKLDEYPDLKLLFLGEPVLITSLTTDYDDWNQLSDIFQEEARMKCKLFNKDKSPWSLFEEQIEDIAKYALNKYKIITPHNIRESLWALSGECTSFRPNILVSIIDIFESKSVLDFSSGWGDRLIACLSRDIEYIGIDPNTALIDGYSKMISTFSTKKAIESQQYKMINSTIEDADLNKYIKNRKIDLIFTSPPYFDFEEYSKEKTQSLNNYRSEQAWLNNFLKVALNKVWDVLEENGILALNIGQRKGQKYIQEMHSYINNSLKGSHYLGVISYINENKRKPQPIWIWIKLKDKSNLGDIKNRLLRKIKN